MWWNRVTYSEREMAFKLLHMQLMVIYASLFGYLVREK